MSQTETLGLLEEIQALVSDKLQVVSYKWLSRNFSVSSRVAKRLLAEFAERSGSGIEVVYTLSGWSKGSSPNYHVKLVAGPKLAEAKQEFDGNCLVQVYSIQACIPKDPAAIWNAEFLQADELFRQPSNVDNCLRDNRFSGILNPIVQRDVDGATVPRTAAQPKSGGVSGGPPSPSAKDTKGENAGGVHDEVTKPLSDKEKISSFPSIKKKGKSVKNSSAAGGSFANFWGHAAAKSMSTDAVLNDVSADAQICGREAIEDGSSDDNAQDVNCKRRSNGESNRKRKVLLDMSDDDEYEEAVNLASPDPPKMQPGIDAKQSSGPLLKRANSIDDPGKVKKLNETELKVKDEPRDELEVHPKPKEDKPKVKEERTVHKEISQTSMIEASVVNGGMTGKAPMAKVENLLPETDLNKDKVAGATQSSSQRRKVLKTQIDERGREVTEVVWEVQDVETKKVESMTRSDHDTNATANTTNRFKSDHDTNATANTTNRPPATQKSPAVGSTAQSNAGGRTGNKKAGGRKDPKQGNILSYFKAK